MVAVDGAGPTSGGRSGDRMPPTAGAGMQRDLDRWIEKSPRLECDWDSLRSTYRRSLVDLAALRFSPHSAGGHSLPAAGLPWFMTMFGRDSIFTSLQALPFAPELAATTLRELALRQGSRVDDFRDEDPGRILHEMRYGELTAFEERPHSPYYGNADATALFVVLLDEYERWTGDRRLVRDLETEARAALNWIEEYADLMGNGYVCVPAPQPGDRPREPVLEGLMGLDLLRRRPPPGVSRGPPASFRATRTTHGCAARGWPGWCGRTRATRRSSSGRRPISSGVSTATSGCRSAASSRSPSIPTGRRSTRSRPTSDTCSGAASSTTPRPASVAAHLMGPKLYSGWGVRTLAEGEGRYNPVGYHVGAVWPFDNSFIAWGLRRYGFKREAARIAAGHPRGGRVLRRPAPEAFGGYGRPVTGYPVQYPTACSPQAWSTGAPLLLLRTMLGLEPLGEHLVVDPALPSSVGHLELLDIPGRWGRLDAFGRGLVDVSE